MKRNVGKRDTGYGKWKAGKKRGKAGRGEREMQNCEL